MVDGQQNRIALVTGASKGLGKALSQELVKQGWTVVGVARSKDALNALQSSLGAQFFLPRVCDVSSSDDVKSISDGLCVEGIIPSLFFLNAGIAGEAACESPTDFVLSKHNQIFATNYFGVLAWVENWLPKITNHVPSTFVVTGSINAIFAPPSGSAYSASKAAIAKAFEGLSLTYPRNKVIFSVVCAGPIATEGLKGKLPFAWKADRMAKYMIKKVLKGSTHIQNSLFYSVLSRMLRVLPDKFVLKFLGRTGEIDE